jgi:hypothetical protein
VSGPSEDDEIVAVASDADDNVYISGKLPASVVPKPRLDPDHVTGSRI